MKNWLVYEEDQAMTKCMGIHKHLVGREVSICGGTPGAISCISNGQIAFQGIAWLACEFL